MSCSFIDSVLFEMNFQQCIKARTFSTFNSLIEKFFIMFQFLVSLIVLNVFIVNTAGQLNAWNYDLDLNGKSTPSWGDSCDPSKILQSPINIIDADVMEFPYPTVLNIEMHSVKPDSISAKRETNSLDFKMKYANNQQPTLSGGPLGTDNYIFEKFHFHWTDTW